MTTTKQHPLVLVLNNIRSVYNVGSLFRTADAAGVTKLILVGYTPAPIDRFGRAREDLAKVALGAEKSTPWEQAETLAETAAQLHTEGFRVVALEQASNSTPLFTYRPPDNLALVLGNEPDGLSPEDLELADDVVEIPMGGIKESLNVSVAAGIALFVLQRNRGVI